MQSSLRRLGTLAALVVLATIALGGCKKKNTVESCKAMCVKIGKESNDRCLLDNPKAICDAAKKDGDESCNRMCESGSKTAAASSSAAPPAAPSSSTFAKDEAGARQLLGQFVAPGADPATLSKTLRPTSEDYKAIFDAETAAKIEAAATQQWDSGHMVIGPKPGQTEVKISSATTEDFKAHNEAAREFPGGYTRVTPHLNDGLVLYRFSFLEPGHEYGMAFDGLTHVNGHWVIVPKPWRMLGRSDDTEPAASGAVADSKPPPSKKGSGPSGVKEEPKAKGGGVRAGQLQVNGRLPPEVIQRIVRQRFGALRQCYEKGLVGNPNLGGRVSVKFVIDRSGAVSTAQDSGSDLPDRNVVSCVVQNFGRMTFPQPEGGIVVVTYPLIFQPGS